MKNNNVALKLVNLMADGKFHSGEYLGNALGMSRAAINKHMRTLKKWGLDISTLIGKGYSLSIPIQLLNKKKILSYLREDKVHQINISIVPIIDSTNQYLLDRMNYHLSSGDTCIAEHQQSGRGRRGRSWYSPFGSNLYLSMYWSMENGPAATMGLSLVVGIVIAEVIQSLGVHEIRVKWPNDLYLYDRKLAGILVEFVGKTGDIAQVVIGVGINLMMNAKGMSEINQNWITLQEAGIKIDRNELAAKIIIGLKKTIPLFEENGIEPFILRWKFLDNFINRPVKLLIGQQEIYGISRGIDNQGSLLLEQNGKVTSWIGGEISLRCNNS